MKTTKGGFTRGEGHVLPRNRVSRNGTPTFDVMVGNGSPENWDMVADRVDGEANAFLIAAAFNAATQVEDMGYDGLETVRALPESLDICEEALAFLLDGQLVAHRLNGKLVNRFETCTRIRALLARLKRGKP